MDNIRVNVTQNGTTTLATEGCYCDRDIDVIVNAEDRYEEGVQAAYDVLWDALQNFGERANYSLFFAGAGWTNDTFKPKYNITPTSANYMFDRCGEIDLIGALERCGVVMDFSKCTTFQSHR